MSAPVASVVVPAFNEEAVIGRCLRALLEQEDAGPLEIVVAANGCVDRTAEVARSFPGVRVLDLPAAGKPGALNRADEEASAFPRIYLDADVELRDGALRGLLDALDCPQPRLAAPELLIDTTGCPRGVRDFYRVFKLLPFATDQVVGRGVYAVNRAGRARFGAFPPAQGDDLYVGRHFAPDEQVSTPGRSVVRAPRSVGALLAVLTRVHRGNAQLSRGDVAAAAGAAGAGQVAGPAGPAGTVRPALERSTAGTAKALAALARARPRLVPAIGTYVGLTLAARAKASVSARSATWDRDATTR